MQDGRALVAVFSKPPLAGQAKTRLAPLLGAEGAAELAAAFLADTLALVRSLPWARPVLATTGPFPPRLASLIEGVALWDQGEGDLGARMERVLARALVEGAPTRALVLGADCPGLTAEHLDGARQALESHDAVLAPSPDGGFYLVGLGRCPPGLFDGVPWSRADTLRRTLDRFERLGFSVALASAFPDVDEPADLLRLEAALHAGELRAPATAAALSRLGRL